MIPPPAIKSIWGGDGLKHRCSYLKKILNMKLLHLIFYVCTLVLRAGLGFK